MEEQLFEFQGERITAPKVLKSNAGYYVGRESLSEEVGDLVPHDRLTDYFDNPELAKEHLRLFRGKDVKELSILGLMKLAQIPREMAERYYEE